MRKTRRATLSALLAVAAGLLASGGPALGAGEDYPARPVRLIVPYAAGGGPDIQARTLGLVLARKLGQPVVIENKVGAGGILAAEYVMQQPPDGYTLLLGSSTHVTQKLLQPSVHFDPARFTHIIRIGIGYSVLLVGAGSPYRNVADLIAAAKRAPGTLNYASGGIGSAAHLFGAAFVSTAGIDAHHIPYRGSVEITTSLIRGDAQFAFPVVSTALPQIRGGKVRALAVTAARRDPALPDVPTLNEALGRTDLGLLSWSGVWGPPGIPAPIVARLHAALTSTLADPALREAYALDGSVISPTDSPAAFSTFIDSETVRFRDVIARNRIVMQ
ncbi:MAG: tripartite tricarboxylate transporter substrate binding protein [Burkholderiales bacterium]